MYKTIYYYIIVYRFSYLTKVYNKEIQSGKYKEFEVLNFESES